MPFLFAFFGAVGGLCLGSQGGVENIVLSFLFALAMLGVSIAKRQTLPYLIGLFVLLCFGLAWRLVLPSYGKQEVVGVVSKTGSNYIVLRTFLSSYYVYAKGHAYQIGDVLKVYGTVKEVKMTTYEAQFSFPNYLATLGVNAEIGYPEVGEVLCFPLRLGRWQKNFLSHFDSSTAALANALLFGRKDYSSSIIASASGLNLLFILSSSGVIYGWFTRLLEKALLTRLSERRAAMVTLICAGLLLPLNIEKIGLWRVFLVRLLKFVDKKSQWFDYPGRIGLSGVILVAVHPFNALSSGLWIGVGISLTRYYFSSFLQEKRKLLSFLKGYAFVQLFLLPLTISNGDIHVFSLIYGPVLLPLVAVFAVLVVLSLFTVPFVDILQGYAGFLERLLQGLGKIDLALPFPQLSVTSTFLLYCALFLGLFLHEMGMKRFRNGMLIGIACVYAVSLLPAGYLGFQGLYFVNVGQGDCTLIYDRGSAVMIDTGGVVGMDIATETLIPYLRKKRIYHLDALIITHQDYDHCGGRDSLMANFNVRRCVEDASEFPIDAGHLHVENRNIYGGSEENERSLVLDFNILGKRVIVAGDATVDIEAKILKDIPDIDCDILKVGHHGSDTSTSEAWLDALTPEIAAISCGRRNSYGHPTKKVLERLEARSITIRRTDLEGSIEYCGWAS